MRKADHTLQWLDRTTGTTYAARANLEKVLEALAANQLDKAIDLCGILIRHADTSQDRAEQGLACHYLGEAYLRMEPPHLRKAVDAFDDARRHFSRGANLIASNQNEGIAYWALAQVNTRLRVEWDDALRHYRSALKNIDHALKSARSHNPTDKQIEILDEIHQEITDDYTALLDQHVMEDPRFQGAARMLQDASKEAKQLIQEVKAAAKHVQPAEITTDPVAKPDQITADLTKKLTEITHYLTKKLDMNREQLLQEITRQISNIGLPAGVEKTESARVAPDDENKLYYFKRTGTGWIITLHTPDLPKDDSELDSQDQDRQKAS